MNHSDNTRQTDQYCALQTTEDGLFHLQLWQQNSPKLKAILEALSLHPHPCFGRTKITSSTTLASAVGPLHPTNEPLRRCIELPPPTYLDQSNPLHVHVGGQSCSDGQADSEKVPWIEETEVHGPRYLGKKQWYRSTF